MHKNTENFARKNSTNLTKKSRVRIKAEIVYKIREFIRILPFHFLVMGSVFIIATIFNKYIEAVCFLVSFFSLRYKFDTTYHSDSIVICMTLTISIFTLSIVICPPIYTYMLFSVIFAYLDCFILWFIRDWQDKNKLLTKNIYSMNEKELYEHCRSRGLSEDDCKIAYFKVIERLKGQELYKAINYSERQAKRKRKYILNTIK